MPGFLTGLPMWVWVLAVIIAIYALYKYWQYKKPTKYAPKIASLSPSDFTSPRDTLHSNGD
jgi:hypothetical protein